MEKEKTPNVSKQLLEDDAAMKGLLALAVDHAEKLIETRGRYSQPETPEERLEKYNQSADPIVNFATRALEEADANTFIRKDDAYRVYQSFTDARDERAASERGFKRQLPGALSTDVEDGRSRSLATPDDENDRVRCWKRIQFTEMAKPHMPDWMLERYADHFEKEESAEEVGEDTETDASNPTLKQLEPGRHTIEATLAEVKEPKPWLQGEGVLAEYPDDGSDVELMDYVVEGDTDPFVDADEGDRVRITNAKLATDRDGLLRVEVSNVCDVEVLPSADADQTSVADAATDGGDTDDQPTDNDTDVQLKQRVREVLQTDYGPGADVTVAGVAGGLSAPPDDVEEVLEVLATEDGALEALEEGYRRL